MHLRIFIDARLEEFYVKNIQYIVKTFMLEQTRAAQIHPA